MGQCSLAWTGVKLRVQVPRSNVFKSKNFMLLTYNYGQPTLCPAIDVPPPFLLSIIRTVEQALAVTTRQDAPQSQDTEPSVLVPSGKGNMHSEIPQHVHADAEDRSARIPRLPPYQKNSLATIPTMSCSTTSTASAPSS